MYSDNKDNKQPDFKEKTEKDIVSKLEATKEWISLSPLQQKIAFTHFTEKDLSKADVAKKVGCSVATVHNFFHTRAYDTLLRLAAASDLRQLIPLSVKAVKDILENGSDKSKGDMAKTVLFSEGILKKDVITDPEKDAKFVWTTDEEQNEENKDTVQPSPKTEGSP